MYADEQELKYFNWEGNNFSEWYNNENFLSIKLMSLRTRNCPKDLHIVINDTVIIKPIFI